MSKPKAPIQVGIGGIPLSEYFNRVLEDPEFLKEPIHCKLPATWSHEGHFDPKADDPFDFLKLLPTYFYCSCGRKLHHSKRRHAFTRRCKCGVMILVRKRKDN